MHGKLFEVPCRSVIFPDHLRNYHAGERPAALVLGLTGLLIRKERTP